MFFDDEESFPHVVKLEYDVVEPGVYVVRLTPSGLDHKVHVNEKQGEGGGHQLCCSSRDCQIEPVIF
jgi:hypothetical protein